MPATKEIKKGQAKLLSFAAPKAQQQDDQVSAWIEYVKDRAIKKTATFLELAAK